VNVIGSGLMNHVMSLLRNSLLLNSPSASKINSKGSLDCKVIMVLTNFFIRGRDVFVVAVLMVGASVMRVSVGIFEVLFFGPLGFDLLDGAGFDSVF
jgi:hypothetical protein